MVLLLRLKGPARYVQLGTRPLAESSFPWMGAGGAIHFPDVLVPGGAPRQAQGNIWAVGSTKTPWLVQGVKAFLEDALSHIPFWKGSGGQKFAS